MKTHRLIRDIYGGLGVMILVTNSVTLVRERTIQTERPPLVGEVSANLDRGVPHGQ
jgi:hypothetical protein